MSRSLIYRSTVGYELLMRILYGRHFGDRLQAIAEEVPPGASVLELCCGPGTLYKRCLHGRVSSYVGLDVNERFLARLRRQGVDARRIDLASSREPLPAADVAIIQASLYHFLPNADRIIDRMLAAATLLVIVAEPVRNLACSTNPLIGPVGRRATNPGTVQAGRRFTERMLDELFEPYRELVLRARLIPGGREKVYTLRSR